MQPTSQSLSEAQCLPCLVLSDEVYDDDDDDEDEDKDEYIR